MNIIKIVLNDQPNAVIRGFHHVNMFQWQRLEDKNKPAKKNETAFLFTMLTQDLSCVAA